MDKHMMHSLKRFCLLLGALVAMTAPALAAENSKSLLDVSAEGVEQRFTPDFGSDQQVTVSRSQDAAKPGVVVTVQPGKAGYPGVKLKPDGAAWDLSAYGHVEARITNLGTKNLNFSLRVDNAGSWQEGPWNTESVGIKPGETGTVTVIFGFSYGRQPGFALKPEAIVNMLLFSGKSDVVQTYRIDSITAAGPAGEKPAVNPKNVRTAPKDGIILGEGTKLQPTQVTASAGAKGTLNTTATGQTLHIELPAGAKGNETVVLAPEVGRWSLRFFTDIRVKIKNDGTTAITPKLQATSEGNGVTDLTSGPEIAPGATAEITIPYAAEIPWTGIPNTGDKPTIWSAPKGSGTVFASDAVGAIKISAAHQGAAAFTVQSIQAKVTTAVLPEWLGKRPPVEGEWVKTLAEEFDGNTINAAAWNIYGPNYWDKKTHWSKDNVILGNGLLTFRFEKKTGFHNDDPNSNKQTPYAGGFLESYGKWVQRYGYFETRIKIPTAEGLWPTFWLMPDRGAAAGPQWKRQDTANGGMEFDIMEHLTRWGPYRYNIAHHWDGYQKNHKQNGCSYVYANPDKDGFITVGFLWLPGQTHYYCNGREVGRWEDPRISALPANIIFETTTGGWDNNAVDDKQLPADYVVDYVRVWQRKDLASAVDGYQAQPKAEAQTPAK